MPCKGDDCTAWEPCFAPCQSFASLQGEIERLRGLLRQCQRGTDIVHLTRDETASLNLSYKAP